MKTKVRRFRISIAGIALLSGVLLIPGTVSAQTNVPDLLSSVPKTVVLDPITGQIISVTAGSIATTSSAITPDISHRNNVCQTTSPVDFCYYGHSPYANQGFYGSAGTWYNTWYQRYAFETGAYTGHACWNMSICSQNFGENTYVTFGGSTVTGTSVTII